MAFPSIDNTDTWKKNLGLLPVPLLENTDKKKFIMLNGGRGNFCLDLNIVQDFDDKLFRSVAWSSDVGHYLSYEPNVVNVLRWDNNRVERYLKESIEKDLERFQTYLQNNHPRKGISIVSFIVRKFLQLWAALGANEFSGQDALRAFLVLLACVKDEESRNGLSLEDWGLSNQAKEVAFQVKEEDWRTLASEIVEGELGYGLRPNISLMLRHASGRLFQEAHYQAVSSPQLVFPGITKDPISLSRKVTTTGTYYTPPSLARSLVEEAIAAFESFPQSLRIFDPACGSGEFLREIAGQLELKQYKGKIELIGWDISEAAIDICKFVLTPICRRSSNISIELECRDSTSTDREFPSDVDVIIMNPPFQSWELMNSRLRERVQKILRNVYGKKPGLVSAFLWRAVNALNEGGIIAAILPASIYDADSYVKLRQELASIIRPRLVARLGGHLIFSNATVHISMFVGIKGKLSHGKPLVYWSNYYSDSTLDGLRQLRRYRMHEKKFDPYIGEDISIYYDDTIASKANDWVPLSYSSRQIRTKLDNLPKIKDRFNVRQGARIGHNTFLIDKSYRDALPSSEQIFFRPAVINKSIRDGQLFDSTYVFYPYGENLPLIENEKTLRDLLKKYYDDHLLPNKAELAKRASVSDKWWLLSRHRTWQVERSPKIVSTEFGHSGSFSWDATGDFIAVRAQSWLPKYTSILPEELGLAYLAVLSSEFMNELLGVVARQIGIEQWSLAAKYIHEMPMPPLFERFYEGESLSEILAEASQRIEEDPELSVFLELVGAGRLIVNGKGYSKERLDELTLSAYRFPSKEEIYR